MIISPDLVTACQLLDLVHDPEIAKIASGGGGEGLAGPRVEGAGLDLKQNDGLGRMSLFGTVSSL